MIATWKILKNISKPSEDVLYNPEHYAAAGGEILVLTLVLSWALTYVFNHDVILSNPLQDRVGYNNLCVGWDTAPARYVAAPLFVFIIFLEVRFMQLDFWRAEVDKTLTSTQLSAVRLTNAANAFAWFSSIGIFSIDPREWPLGHTLAFVQLVVFGYIGFFANFIETDSRYHPMGSWVFVAVFGVISLGFGTCAMTQMVAYDSITKQQGPIPWQVMMALDYGYFACMGLQAIFRPAAPSLCASYRLVSDEDYNLQQQRRQEDVKYLGGSRA